MRLWIVLALIGLVLGAMNVQASTTGSNTPPAPPLVVKPKTQGSNGDVRVKNGMSGAYEDKSRGNAIITPGTGATDATSSEVKLGG